MAEDSSGDQAAADRPLTHASAGSSPSAGHAYAPNVRRTDGGVQAAGSSGKPAASDWSPGESYAEVLRRRGGPQEMEPSELMDTLLNSPGGCHDSWGNSQQGGADHQHASCLTLSSPHNLLTKTRIAVGFLFPPSTPAPHRPPPTTATSRSLAESGVWSGVGVLGVVLPFDLKRFPYLMNLVTKVSEQTSLCSPPQGKKGIKCKQDVDIYVNKGKGA